jgi:two-component system, NarL family, sensor kinase
MPKAKRAVEKTPDPLEALKHSLIESREIVCAIRNGRIDALVVDGQEGEQVLVLQGAEHPYRVLVESINDGAATLDADGTVLYSNKRFAEILHVSSQHFVGTLLQSHFSPSRRQNLEQLIHKALTDSSDGEITLDVAGERPRLIRFSFSPVRNSENQNICVVATELTELMEASEALRSNEESLRQLSARLLQLQDEERRRIARDLHDTTGQKLAIQSILLARLDKASKGFDEESRKLLAECKTLNAQLVDEVRTVSYLLHPPLLDELGLASAVEWYAEGFARRTGIATDVKISPKFLRLPPDIEVTFFRIVQESLTNVHRYSGSSTAYVRLTATADQVIVEVGDHGKGIESEKLNARSGTVAPLGVGIQGMTERMRQLSGTLEIKSKPKSGTVVIATLPMARTSKESTDDNDDLQSGTGTQTSSPLAGGVRKRILIADDHEMLRRGVCSALQKQTGWELCGEAVNGREAVEKATRLQPDLVIMDVEMPVLNGLAAAREILRNCPQTKILIFTVHESDQIVKDIYAAGVHACLSKDKGGRDLLRVVRELLESNVSYSSTAASQPA